MKLRNKAYAMPAFAITVFVVFVLAMSVAGRMPLMDTSWDAFLNSMKSFFETGLGGPGFQGVGIAIAAIGLIAAGISFAVHKFNPQSRMPGWITCLAIGLVGAMLMGGIAGPLGALENARDLVFGWFGV